MEPNNQIIHSYDDLLQSISLLEQQLLKAPENNKLDDLFVLKRWITTCHDQIAISYPFSLKLTEKPDFVLAGNSVTGIEVTKLLAEQRRRAEILAGRKGVGHSPTSFDFDSPKRKNDNINKIISSQAYGSSTWREVDSMADMYAKEIARIVAAKSEKVITNGLHQCDNNILVIEDHHMNSNLNREILYQLLVQPMQHNFSKRESFNEIWFTSLIEADCAVCWKSCSQTV